MADQTTAPGATNPDAEAAALAAAKTKQPPAIPAAVAQETAAPARTIDPAKLQTALAAVNTANDAIDTAGDVTGNLRVAVSGLATATKYLNLEIGKLPASAAKA